MGNLPQGGLKQSSEEQHAVSESRICSQKGEKVNEGKPGWLGGKVSVYPRGVACLFPGLVEHVLLAPCVAAHQRL